MKKIYITPLVENHIIDLYDRIMAPGPVGSPLNPTNNAPQRRAASSEKAF